MIVPCLRMAAFVLLLLLGGCVKSEPPKLDPNAVAHTMRGRVMRLNPGDQIATIQHEAVEGWMEAMTMDFLVMDEKGFQLLHTGDRITATLMVGKTNFWIREIHREF
ncbi:MAG: copper-binding protein [Bryobacteraceae bacterium]